LQIFLTEVKSTVKDGPYQFGILGRPGGQDKPLLHSLGKRLVDLGLEPDAVNVIQENDIGKRNRKKPFIGVFFGYAGAQDLDHPILRDLLADSVVLIPSVDDLPTFSNHIPASLHHINGLQLAGDIGFARLTSLVLENFRLLRSDRRLFISYRRSEAQSIAIQIYERLDALGFDVFLDTRGVPPAADFQQILWHRLADSDVVVLLDTPGFRESRWTRAELARANATSIQILHLLWPGSAPDGMSAFSEFHEIPPDYFVNIEQTGVNARLKDEVLTSIGVMVESLRARALAARHRYLVDNFCDQARALGHSPSIQSSRFISLELGGSKNIAVVPAIGIPSAARYQEIENAIAGSGVHFAKAWLLYDERGILDSWLEHVEWLNKHLPLSAVRVSDSSVRIKGEAS
jgi:hypothetical protein